MAPSSRMGPELGRKSTTPRSKVVRRQACVMTRLSSPLLRIRGQPVTTTEHCSAQAGLKLVYVLLNAVLTVG